MLASGQGKREEQPRTYSREPDQMRALVLACLGVLAGCIIDNDPIHVESFYRRPARNPQL
jgi:hypothetical protein